MKRVLSALCTLAVAAAFLARTIGRPQVISCDIGGTSCDTALIASQFIRLVSIALRS